MFCIVDSVIMHFLNLRQEDRKNTFPENENYITPSSLNEKNPPFAWETGDKTVGLFFLFQFHNAFHYFHEALSCCWAFYLIVSLEEDNLFLA